MTDLDLTPGQPKLAEIILPELVWQTTLDFLKDPEDILNAGKTCTLFERLLHSKLVAANLGKTLPLLMNWMDSKSILNCRLVSRGWRDVVDNLFQDYFLERPAKTLWSIPRGLEAFPNTFLGCALYTLTNKVDQESKDYQHFIKEMKDHPRNPFIGRAVRFKLSELDSNGRYQDFQPFYNFFKTFGKHIWSLELLLSGIRSTHYLFRFIIKDVFLLTPNLKNFSIITNGMVIISIMNKEEIKALPPPPALDRLDISKANFNENDAVPEMILLRHSNTKLGALHIPRFELLGDLYWPNLKELHVKDVVREWGKFDALSLNSKLPKLELLSTDLGSHYAGIPFRREAFTTISRTLYNLRTCPRLETLRLNHTRLWKQYLIEPPIPFSGSVECPESIKTLEIPEADFNYQFNRTFGHYSDYSFLLLFDKVEKIHVEPANAKLTKDEVEKLSENEIVQVYKFMFSGRMYESNIWELLPNLKIFSFGRRVYTRNCYERRGREEEKV